MPNWCCGQLTIRGNEEDLKRFDEQFKKPYTTYRAYSTVISADSEELVEKEISRRMKKEEIIDYRFSKTEGRENDSKDCYNVNVITEIVDVKNKYSFNNFMPKSKEDVLNGWYDWNCANWGTKWDGDIYFNNINSEINEEILYNITTAWSPAIPIIEAMYKKFPMLDFRYEFEEAGCEIFGLVTIDSETGELLIETPETHGISNEEFIIKVFGQEDRFPHTCSDCNSMVEYGEDICYRCGSENLKERQVAN